MQLVGERGGTEVGVPIDVAQVQFAEPASSRLGLGFCPLQLSLIPNRFAPLALAHISSKDGVICKR